MKDQNGMSNIFHSALITDASKTTVVIPKTLGSFAGLTLVTANIVLPLLPALTWMIQSGFVSAIVSARGLTARVSAIPVITVNLRHSVAHITARHLTVKMVAKQGCSAPLTPVLIQVV
jgi:hypothetical protein